MTTPPILIRDETQDDAAVITDVTAAAFASMAISHHTEPFIIQALRSAGALTVSLVAEVEGRVVGHIAFSPVALSDGTPHWYGLGPVSVLPRYQRRGVGKALIQEGLSRLKALGAKGCCLVGHPHYYRQFGFEQAAGLVHPRCFSRCRLRVDFRTVRSRSMKASTLRAHPRWQRTRPRPLMLDVEAVDRLFYPIMLTTAVVHRPASRCFAASPAAPPSPAARREHAKA